MKVDDLVVGKTYYRVMFNPVTTIDTDFDETCIQELTYQMYAKNPYCPTRDWYIFVATEDGDVKHPLHAEAVEQLWETEEGAKAYIMNCLYSEVYRLQKIMERWR